MGAELSEHPNPAFAVAENDQVLSEQPCLDRRAVGHNLFGQAGGDPMPAHDLTHRSVALDTAQEIVLFGGHGRSLRAASLMRGRFVS
jgi:hypothetical protein